MARPDLSRVPEWFHRYIAQVEGDDLLPVLIQQQSSFVQFLENLPADKIDYRYGPDKWTIKEVLQHIIDAERVFLYRALCIARGEKQSLPGFDENEYAANSKAHNRNWNDMLEEFKAVRRSSEILFASFDNEQLEATGISNKNPIYVLAIGFIIAGHLTHHLNIIKERYL
ncbi:MAG: DinB family protein [Chitinophagaceae bacterium]|nr:DinB family protein [Chitinophagaceae bacterium]